MNPIKVHRLLKSRASDIEQNNLRVCAGKERRKERGGGTRKSEDKPTLTSDSSSETLKSYGNHPSTPLSPWPKEFCIGVSRFHSK